MMSCGFQGMLSPTELLEKVSTMSPHTRQLCVRSKHTTQKSTGIYRVQSVGTVVDTQSGLMWKQCAEGLSGTTCATGGVSSMSWDAGVVTANGNTFAGYNDWRMPTLTELQSLLPSDCSNPKINTVVFPNTPLIFYWTGSPFAGSTVGVWYVNFSVGGSFGNTRDTAHYVRLVRDGQSFDILTPAAQTLTFSAPPTLPFGGSGMVTATSAAPNSGNPVVYASTTPAVCSVNANNGLVGLAAGALVGNTCTVSANQFGRASNGENYAQAAQVTQNVVVSKGAQSVAFGVAPAVNVGTTGTLSATSSQAITPLSFSTLTPSVCTLSGLNNSVVTGVSAGICTVTASAPTNATYLPVSVNQSFSIGAAPPLCNLRMDGVNPMLAAKEGLVLIRAMLGFTGTAVTQGTGIPTPWETIRDGLNAKCGTNFF